MIGHRLAVTTAVDNGQFQEELQCNELQNESAVNWVGCLAIA